MTRSIPLIALMAFSFVTMMFNVPPLPGGTADHAAGAVPAAVMLDLEAAVKKQLSITITPLVTQIVARVNHCGHW